MLRARFPGCHCEVQAIAVEYPHLRRLGRGNLGRGGRHRLPMSTWSQATFTGGRGPPPCTAPFRWRPQPRPPHTFGQPCARTPSLHDKSQPPAIVETHSFTETGSGNRYHARASQEDSTTLACSSQHERMRSLTARQPGAILPTGTPVLTDRSSLRVEKPQGTVSRRTGGQQRRFDSPTP